MCRLCRVSVSRRTVSVGSGDVPTEVTEGRTLLLHGGLGVLHGLPGAGYVQEDGVRRPDDPEPVLAHVLVPDGDQVVHAVLPELLRRRLRPLLVELHRVQVTRGGDGAQDGVGEGATARSWWERGGGEGMRTATSQLMTDKLFRRP